MKVTIQERRIYHKFAEIEIDIDDNVTQDDIQDYLHNRGDIDDKIEQAMSKTDYEYGFGCDNDSNIYYNSAMNQIDSETEIRYNCDKLKTGGHL
jgi:hypothetical protein